MSETISLTVSQIFRLNILGHIHTLTRQQLELVRRKCDEMLFGGEKADFVAIKTAIAVTFGIDSSELDSPHRTHSVVYPRWGAFLLCREHGMTYEWIGRNFCKPRGMDHGSVLHGVVQGRLLEQNDKIFASKLKASRERLGRVAV